MEQFIQWAGFVYLMFFAGCGIVGGASAWIMAAAFGSDRGTNKLRYIAMLAAGSGALWLATQIAPFSITIQ